ncbi:MAG: PQQ-like beta-propeller repeat protein [Gemmataceae bacterium]|nr:PQQ-like beta-propeller repeat protein [Gemmataceae bacterium]
MEPLVAGDWPTFLGPSGNGVSPEKGLPTQWPKEGLRKLWSCELGLGYAPPVVARGKLYHFDRFGDNARLSCRDARTGKLLWKFEYPTAYEDYYGYEPGPRACPVVDDDHVYIHGVEGMLHCLKATNGELVWKCDTQATYHFHQNFFGVASVPLVVGNRLIVPVGGSPKGPRPLDFRKVQPNGTALVAFDKRTGKVLWTSGDELASYTSPLLANLHDRQVVLYFARGGLLAVDPLQGKVLFHFPWRARMEESVNAANPVVVDTCILLSECYGPGSVLLRIEQNWKPQVIWSDADKDRWDRSLAAHWCTPIHIDGYLYGCSGRETAEADLRCLHFRTGEVQWIQRRTGRCTLLAVDNYLLALNEFGTLYVLKPNPRKYEEIIRYEVPDLEYPCWAPPVLSDGVLYLRGKRRMVALELMPHK